MESSRHMVGTDRKTPASPKSWLIFLHPGRTHRLNPFSSKAVTSWPTDLLILKVLAQQTVSITLSSVVADRRGPIFKNRNTFLLNPNSWLPNSSSPNYHILWPRVGMWDVCLIVEDQKVRTSSAGVNIAKDEVQKQRGQNWKIGGRNSTLRNTNTDTHGVYKQIKAST